ncbi:hypothetical protein P9204_07965 [Geobacillus stearothermophilus]|nr:hypothetical protein [Geobacillus stearothermophilus]
MSINIHIIDKERRKYSAHFMMWLNSYEARCLQRCVEQAKHKVGAAAHPEPSANRPHRALFALSAKEIGVASLTSGGALGVVAALCGFLSPKRQPQTNIVCKKIFFILYY